MRNLKRALSLTLASVMLLGMMVVGSSAAAGYSDVAETDNVEAIEVLQAIEVMVGDERGFGPERPVNRAEMAVVMGKLLNLDYNYYTATCPFNDVYDWAQGWVGACYANGIVSGRGEGVYDPGTTVTAVEAASMLMRALGYFKYQSDYAEGFEVATVKQANTIGLFDGVNSNTNAPLTRNQVAQMALNALKSGVVTADGNALNFIDGNGNVIATGGKVNYVYVTSNKAFATAISSVRASSMGSTNDAPIVELGEQLYNGELRLNDRDLDVFQRPARTWEFKGEQVGTYVKRELLKQEYTTEVTGKDLYDLLTKNTIDEYTFTIAIDGETEKNVLDGYGYFTTGNLVRTNTKGVGATGKGVLTQVYVDTLNEEVYIAVINTYLAKASKDYDAKREEATFKVWNLDQVNNRKALVKDGKTTELKVSNDDFDVSEIEKDDIVLVRVADNAIQQFITPEVISDTTISSFKRDDWVNNGTKYDYASTAMYDEEVLEDYNLINMKETTFNIYLDPYGYMIGLEANADPDQYVFLTGIDGALSNLYAKNVDANIIHMDGTMETVKVNLADSKDGSGRLLSGVLNNRNLSQLNAWCTYSVSANGTYTLKLVPIADDVRVVNDGKDGSAKVKVAQYGQDVHIRDLSDSTDTKNIKEKRPSLFSYYKTMASGEYGYVYGNDETVYLNVTLEDIIVDDNSHGGDKRRIIDDVESVTVGLKNVDIEVVDLKDTDGTNHINQVDPAKNVYLAPDAEIYTLYNVDGVVIAAVTIGKDNGTSSTWAYITSKTPTQEDYAHATGSREAKPGEWTWYRDAIINGEKTQLIEVGDTLNYLGNKYNEGDMQQGQWYEIKYNADGYVRNAELLSTKLGFALPNAEDGKFMTEVNQVEPTMNHKDGAIILHKVLADGNTLSLSYENGTLWTNTRQTEGFSVSPDVKVVVCLAELNKGYTDNPTFRKGIVSQFDTVTDGYTGYAGLETAIRDLDYNFFGDLSAIIENGRATTIILNDCYGTYVDQGNSTVRGQYLDLYGNLYTDRFNDDRNQYAAIVTVDDGEVEPTSRGTDAYGAYTRYNIKPGAYVVIRDADIDTGAAFVTNITGRDYRVNNRNNTISFTMPTGTAFIDGFNQGIANDMVGVFDGDNTNLNNITATFNGKDEDKDIGVMEPGDPVDVVIKMNGARALTLKADTEYTVKIGDPVSAVTRTSTESATIEFTYRLTNNDIRRGEIVIWDITEGKGGEDPNPPQPGDKLIEVSNLDEMKAAMTKAELNKTLPTTGDNAYWTANNVWKNEAGETVTTAAAAGKYTYTVTLTAKDGYKFADGKTFTFTGEATVAATPDPGETTEMWIDVSGGAGTTWLVITLDKDGNEVSKRFHNGPKPAGRMATVETISMDAGTRILITTNGKVFCDVLVAEDGTLKDLKKTDFSVLTKHPTVDGAYVLASPKMVGAPAVTGDAEFKNDKLTVQLGQPIADGILPTEIKVDDKATATIEWYEADGTTKVTESVAEAGKTYTYKVTGLKAANGESVTAPVTVVTETGKTYEVSPYSFKSGVEIKTDGTMTTVPGSVTEVEQGGNSKDYKEVEKSLTKDEYTVRWDTAKPNNTELKAMLDKDLKEVQKLDVKETEWKANKAGEILTVTLNNGAEVDYTIKLVEMTKVFYNGEMAGWVGEGSNQVSGVAKSAYLVAGADKNVKASVAVATTADGKATVTPTGSELWLFDGVAIDNDGLQPTHYKDAGSKKTAMVAGTEVKAVRPGTVLYITGGDQSGALGKEISLKANDTTVMSKVVEQSPVTWVLPDTGVLAAWAKDGKVKFSETGSSITVKLVDGAETKTFTGTTDGVKITGLDANSMWLKGTAKAAANGDNVLTADEDGVLNIASEKLEATGTTTYTRVYTVVFDTANWTSVEAVKDVTKWATSSTSGTGNCIAKVSSTGSLYAAEGADVVIAGKTAKTFLKADAKVPTFKQEKDLTVATDGPKYVYSFKMPANNVYAGNITKVGTFEVKNAEDVTPSGTVTLNKAGCEFKMSAELGAGVEVEGTPVISGWYTKTSAGKYVSAKTPTNLDTPKIEAAEGGKWTITFKPVEGKVVPVPPLSGDKNLYFFEVKLDGMFVMAELEVQAATISTADDLKAQIAATPKGETITVSSAITGTVEIPADAVVELKGSGALVSPTVTGTLIVPDSSKVTGTVTMNGGTLSLTGTTSKLPAMAEGAKGTVEIGGEMSNPDGISDSYDLADAIGRQASAALNETKTVSVAPVQFKGDDGKIMSFNSSWTLLTYKNDKHFANSEKFGFYHVTMTGLADGDKITGERFYADGTKQGTIMSGENPMELTVSGTEQQLNLLEGDEVHSVVFTVKSSSDEVKGTITFYIGG